MNSTEIHKALRKINTRTGATEAEIEGLRALGLVYKNTAGLTMAGKNKLRYLDRTGDGPESLKALFRF